jgi:uncharacterized pyridoxamine 5'-phosphate oxidase family protein
LAFPGAKENRACGTAVKYDPELKGMYSAEDDNTQVLYFRNATATFSSFTAEPQTIQF